MPVARTRTSTSPGRTTGTGASSKNNCSGPPRPWVLTAFTGIPPSLLFSRAADAMHFGKVAQRRLVRIVGTRTNGVGDHNERRLSYEWRVIRREVRPILPTGL